jgi:DNA-binding response OmpR family regulator
VVKIVAVDDEPDIIRLLQKIITRAGYDFVGFTDPKEFLRCYLREKPDLVLLDIMMPEMDGWEVYKEIRKFNPEQKVVPLTALDLPETLKRGVMELGASDYITKPFDPAELIEKVKRILKAK